jgi:hypothetical protein
VSGARIEDCRNSVNNQSAPVVALIILQGIVDEYEENLSWSEMMYSSIITSASVTSSLVANDW